MKKILKTAYHFEQLLKTAIPTDMEITSTVKSTVEDLIDTYEVLEGVLYASNVQIQHQPDYVYVHFILNIDQDEKETLTQHESQRQEYIKNGVWNALKQKFPNQTWKIRYTEAFTKNSWFGKKYE